MKLPDYISTREDAMKFMTELVEAGWAFHPDDDAHGILWSTGVTPPTKEECTQLNKLMRQLFDLDWDGTDTDPYDFMLRLLCES